MSAPASVSFYYYTFTIVIASHLCVGCCVCMEVCPEKNVIGLNAEKKAFVRNKDKCRACFKCLACPAKAIRVRKEFHQDARIRNNDT